MLGTSYFAGALAGSSVVLLDAPAEPEPEVEDELEDGSAFCSLLGAAELELEELLGAAVEPPEAEPDFAVSAVEELEELGALGGVTPMVVLDEDEPGAAGAEVPPAAELEAPGAEEVRLVSSRLHAARLKANATASARVVSFMCPPGLDTERSQQNARPI